MPDIGTHWTFGGYVAFAVVKLIAYVSVARVLNARFRASQNVYGLALVRTSIGMAVGAAYCFTTQALTGKAPDTLLGFIPYWLSLVPLRIGEWWITLQTFYPPRRCVGNRTAAIFDGVMTSCISDLPGAIGWFVVGGFWIC